ncbi:hypothetical protein LCGC14_1334820 [marine sediment metagenome]|uniref:Uncharacterized protein n=1 Tax=marine sediment metagenome TaxID=412755 RepID=A0A0F9L1J2_9ZZZZ
MGSCYRLVILETTHGRGTYEEMLLGRLTSYLGRLVDIGFSSSFLFLNIGSGGEGKISGIPSIRLTEEQERF